MSYRVRRLVGILILGIGCAVVMGLLVEPFLPVSPIVQQASVGLVLTSYGSVLLLGAPLVKQAIQRRRARKLLSRTRRR